MDDHVRRPGVADTENGLIFRKVDAHARRVRLVATLLTADFMALGIAFLLPALMQPRTSSWFAIFCVALPIYFGTAFNSGAYSVGPLRRSVTGSSGALRSLLFTFATLFLIAYFLRVEQRLSRLLLLMTMVSAACFFVLARQLAAFLIRRRTHQPMYAELLINDNVTLKVPKDIVVADAEQIGLAPNLRDPLMMDRFAKLVRGMDRVVIACRPDVRERWAMMLRGANVHGEIVVDNFDAIGAVGINHLDGELTLVVSTGPLDMPQRIAKRTFDLLFSAPVLIGIMPIMLLTAIAIKLDSRGPVFFRQRRVGRGNAFFYIMKFRSMHVALGDADGKVSTSRNDNRITRVGKFIRRTSIDELPQLLNVLFGSMSLVGPRPHALGSLAGEHLFWDVDERYWHRHALKPGITGLAQVRGFRGATHHRDDLTQRLQADLEYISHWSLWRDFRILFSTLKVIVHHNTY